MIKTPNKYARWNFPDSLILGSIQWSSEINTNLQYCVIAVYSFLRCVSNGVNLYSQSAFIVCLFWRLWNCGIMRMLGWDKGIGNYIPVYWMPLWKPFLCISHNMIMFHLWSWRELVVLTLVSVSFIWHLKLTFQAKLINTVALSYINQKTELIFSK